MIRRPPRSTLFPLHDALPIWRARKGIGQRQDAGRLLLGRQRAGLELDALEAVLRNHAPRSEEHTSELQSQSNLVCRLLLEKKKKKTNIYATRRNTRLECRGMN